MTDFSEHLIEARKLLQQAENAAMLKRWPEARVAFAKAARHSLNARTAILNDPMAADR